ncbi:hypothetical protein KL905_003298 [Ogataea polymorpha]|uniref:uncharacterized protein n=1 Tax=Ogataea polymorpha TaxID=460523 RepID=UPI0007F41995|nr:uncharacterized protein OGAPODRAFT_75588 [Ogataea polymorpha]KAG7879303.1 hypothetical protein KL937_003064 [Ogataea polymorpha]KAG7909143.1 hypothetical protein KL906_002637 [Ogataea polymorpha]KAG7916125.1 hypothetical protein KL927_003590 [Ogataea polymorpha]KAG7920664.1 hypothetical protein KL905_003298 [Ogataea polymorpha]KAG7934911.1 hypothetical protein KL904_003243 [Ogataea polymorpha]
MRKDYVLEVKSSDTKCPDVIYQDDSKQTQGTDASETRPQKYIKFTVRSARQQDGTLTLVVQLVLLAAAVCALYVAICNGQILDRILRRAQLEKTGLNDVWIARTVRAFVFLVCYRMVNWAYGSFRAQTEESLIIIPNLGVQIESYRVRKSGSASVLLLLSRVLGKSELSRHVPAAKTLNRQFFPMEDVRDLAIVEGFKNFQVIFYLALMVGDGPQDDQLQIVVIFPNLLPRKKLLQAVWRRSREYLDNSQ